MMPLAVRHLHTAWNRAGHLQSRADIPIEPSAAAWQERLRPFPAWDDRHERVPGFGRGGWLRVLRSRQEHGGQFHTHRVTLADNQILRFDSPAT